jgi:hypothetical protein
MSGTTLAQNTTNAAVCVDFSRARMFLAIRAGTGKYCIDDVQFQQVAKYAAKIQTPTAVTDASMFPRQTHIRLA